MSIIVLLSPIHRLPFFFSFFELSFINLKPLFSIQREIIITSLFRKLTKVSTNNIKIDINLFPNKPWFLRVCSINLWKTLWEKDKLLVTSNFSFPLSVF